MVEGSGWQGALREAINERHGSVLGYARFRAGEGADDKAVERARRQINKWLAGTVPTGTSAASLAVDLGVDPDIFPTPTRQADRYSELRQLVREGLDRQETIRRTLESLRGSVDHAARAADANRQSLEGLHEDVAQLRADLAAVRSFLEHGRSADRSPGHAAGAK